MFPAFGLTLALLAPAAPIPKDVVPAGPAPYILNLKSEDDGKVRFTVLRIEKVKVTEVTIQLGPNNQQIPVQTEREVTVTKYARVELAELKDVKVYSVEGKEIDAKEAGKRLSEKAMAIASSNGAKVDPAFLKLFKDDVLILVSPDLQPNGGDQRGRFIMPGGPVMMPAMPLLPAPGVAPALPAPALLPPPPLPVQIEKQD